MSHATDLVAANFCSTHLRAHTSHGLIALLLPSRLVVSFSGLWILALGLGAMPGRGGARPSPPNFGKTSVPNLRASLKSRQRDFALAKADPFP